MAFGSSWSGLDAAGADLAAHVRGSHLSFETDRRPERITEARPAEMMARLRMLKKPYDPGSVFRDNFNIDPLGE